jgi:hypothetical protein
MYKPFPHVRTLLQTAPLSMFENVEPAVHAAHLRSAVVEPGADMPSPTGHVAQAEQLSVASVVLVPALKRPAPHSRHCRSLLALAATVVRRPGPHDALTSWHAAPLSTFENVEPAVQPAHWRSADLEPGTNWPWPAGHVAHVAQRIKPALAVNVPVLQLSHVRSLLAVASAVVYLPAMHGLLTASQVAVPPTAVNVTPIWHGEQLLFSVAVPAAYP